MSQKKAANTSNILQFFNRRPVSRDPADEIPVGLPRAVVRPSGSRVTLAPAVDLSGKPKVWLTIGSGRVGKTTLLRWAIEEVQASGAQAICAAADPGPRSLDRYFEGVAEPPTNDAVAVTQWLEELFQFVSDEKASAFVDLGGGDTSFARMLDQTPDLADVMEQAGVPIVAMYIIGPRIDDLAALASFETAGFRPKATGLVLNEGLADPSSRDLFDAIVAHSAYRAAIDRGAIELRMPRLLPELFQEIEMKRLGFAQVRDGKAPEGRRVEMPGPFSRSRVRKWLATMSEEFTPVRSWLP